MNKPKIRFEFTVPNFFFLPMAKMEFEAADATGRCYFIHKGRIVAVGRRL